MPAKFHPKSTMNMNVLKSLAAAVLGTAALVVSAPSAEAQVVNVRTVRVMSGLNFPVFVTAAPGDSTRLFVVLKGGQIRVFDRTTNTLLATPFLTVTVAGGTSVSDERGLLGLAFDPGYAKNGQFYVYHTGTNTNVLARYKIGRAHV